jgi:hypothetical protein
MINTGTRRSPEIINTGSRGLQILSTRGPGDSRYNKHGDQRFSGYDQHGDQKISRNNQHGDQGAPLLSTLVQVCSRYN